MFDIRRARIFGLWWRRRFRVGKTPGQKFELCWQFSEKLRSTWIQIKKIKNRLRKIKKLKNSFFLECFLTKIPSNWFSDFPDQFFKVGIRKIDRKLIFQTRVKLTIEQSILIAIADFVKFSRQNYWTEKKLYFNGKQDFKNDENGSENYVVKWKTMLDGTLYLHWKSGSSRKIRALLTLFKIAQIVSW